MCGRYFVSEAEMDDFSALVERIGLDLLRPRTNPDGSYDLFPGDPAPVFVSSNEKALPLQGSRFSELPQDASVEIYRWGFPSPAGGGLVINARAETVSQKPLFRLPLQNARCLVPARGFYEWSEAAVSEEVGTDFPEQMELMGLPDSFSESDGPSITRSKRPKRPRIRHRFVRADGQMLMMAGLYWTFRLSATEERTAFTILTVPANGPVARVHDRMPLIVNKDDVPLWLASGRERNPSELLVPADENILCLVDD